MTMTLWYRSFLLLISLCLSQILVGLPTSNTAKEAISIHELDLKTQQKITKKQAKIAKKVAKNQHKHRGRRAGRGIGKGLLIMLVGLGLGILGFAGLGGILVFIGFIALIVGIVLFLLRILF